MIVYQEMTEANAEEQCTMGLEFTPNRIPSAAGLFLFDSFNNFCFLSANIILCLKALKTYNIILLV